MASRNKPLRVLVIGGYGFFGRRIAQLLAGNEAIQLLIGGRDLQKAQRQALALVLAAEQGVMLDVATDITSTLQRLQVDVVIHTAGPFQQQRYTVAEAAIAAGVHYIDLADGREFVAGIQVLDERARAAGVLVTSGASSLPALSSAVVDQYLPRFRLLTAIRCGIASGARAPGLATMQGVFGYCGNRYGAWLAVPGPMCRAGSIPSSIAFRPRSAGAFWVPATFPTWYCFPDVTASRQPPSMPALPACRGICR
ncbi:MAG: saccharopine dehydrogenase NADP-binding domain-containing protein [Janthinobacterium lividum]